MRALILATLSIALAVVPACGGGGGNGGNNNTPMGPTEVEDQSVVPNPPDILRPIGDVDCAQTLLTAAAGRLTRVALLLSAPAMSMGTLRVDVRSATAGVPELDDDAVFGFVEIDVSTLPLVPTWVSFEFPNTINITATQSIAIVARRVDGMGDICNIHGLSSNVYGNGQPARRGGAVWGADPTIEFGFRTFVLP